LELSNKDSEDEYIKEKTIQLDFSDLGIEIGEMPWNDITEDYDDFIPEVSLDTDQTKQMKKYKKDIKNYNL
jgi:hypothetical protein